MELRARDFGVLTLWFLGILFLVPLGLGLWHWSLLWFSCTLLAECLILVVLFKLDPKLGLSEKLRKKVLGA